MDEPGAEENKNQIPKTKIIYDDLNLLWEPFLGELVKHAFGFEVGQAGIDFCQQFRLILCHGYATAKTFSAH
jgi:hypothetical protein